MTCEFSAGRAECLILDILEVYRVHRVYESIVSNMFLSYLLKIQSSIAQ